MNIVATSDKVTIARVIQVELSDSCIKKLADALKQKTGKWYEDEEVGLCRCDQCQAVNLIHTPFCPMCGARMVGEEE